MISQPKDYDILRPESNYDHMKRLRKRRKFWYDIASIIMAIAITVIALYLRAKYA